MTVVVAGAAGHVGANLVRALLAQSIPVRAAIHQDRRLRSAWFARLDTAADAFR